MNCCLCLILIKSCLVLSSDMRAVPGHPAGGETVKLITTTSKHLISASTGVPPSVPPAGARFHAASFVGGMTLAFILILAVTLGYRLACSQRDVRYRAIGKRWISKSYSPCWRGFKYAKDARKLNNVQELKNIGQFNCSGQTRDSRTTITKHTHSRGSSRDPTFIHSHVRNMMPSFKTEPLRKYSPKHMLVMI